MIRKRLKYLTFLRNILCFMTIFIVVFIYRGAKVHKEMLSARIPITAVKYISMLKEPNYTRKLSIEEIRVLVNQYNVEQKITNIDVFGKVNADTVILVILIDQYTEYLKYLLLSLSQSTGIEDILLIFSHSHYDEQIINAIENIDFCRVMQIFFPYSVEFNPNRFPGYEPGDCLYDMDPKTAEKLNCTGAFTPDIHGRYRSPSNSEKKHHWWWTANQVFEKLSCVEEHEGLVLFTEDDKFFVEDFIFMAIQMKKIAESSSQCEFISLGSNIHKMYTENDTFAVEQLTWDPTYHSMVFGFDINTWNIIISHYDLFCKVDDYSWTRSLYYLSLNRRVGSRFKVLNCVFPRAFKTSIKFYERFLNFDLVESVYQVIDFQSRYQNYLYPPFIEVYTFIEMESDDFIIFDYVDGNGGWNDERDKDMCTNMTLSKIKKVILEMRNDLDKYI